MATRVNAFFEVQVPVATTVAYAAGAFVNGTQISTNTVTVHSGHSLVDEDKFLYALTDRNILFHRVFTVTTATSTTVLFGGGVFSFPDGSILIPLGTDTGGLLRTDGSYTIPNWDGSTIGMFSDSAGDDAITRAPVNPSGQAGFYASSVPVWVLGLNTGNTPVQMLIDIGADSAGGGGTGITRGASFPVSPSLGDQHLLIVGARDILYIYMNSSSGNAWVEGISAP